MRRALAGYRIGSECLVPDRGPHLPDADEETIRILSARRGTAQERSIYEKGEN